MKYIIALTLAVSMLSCSWTNSLKVENVDQYKGISYYRLSDDKISVVYASSMCPCIAREVLDEVKRRVESKELDWLKMADDKFAQDYLEKVCREMLKK
jgi:hypothetical protein